MRKTRFASVDVVLGKSAIKFFELREIELQKIKVSALKLRAVFELKLQSLSATPA